MAIQGNNMHSKVMSFNFFLTKKHLNYKNVNESNTLNEKTSNFYLIISCLEHVMRQLVLTNIHMDLSNYNLHLINCMPK